MKNIEFGNLKMWKILQLCPGSKLHLEKLECNSEIYSTCLFEEHNYLLTVLVFTQLRILCLQNRNFISQMIFTETAGGMFCYQNKPYFSDAT